MTEPFLNAVGLTKRYGRQVALDHVDLAVNNREVVALLGDNGAGKSTLVRIISGIESPGSGEFFVEGRPARIGGRRDSERLGIETIYQDIALVDSLSIARNIFMGRELVIAFGLLRHREMDRVARTVLRNTVSISGIDSPRKEVGALSGGQKQAVAIARAVHFKRRLLILDEPTSALSVRETQKLLEHVVELKTEGVSSLLVTHNMYHAYDVCDRFVVLSHGRKTADVSKHEIALKELTALVAQS